MSNEKQPGYLGYFLGDCTTQVRAVFSMNQLLSDIFWDPNLRIMERFAEFFVAGDQTWVMTGGFKDFLLSHLGEDEPILTSIFFKGLVQPPPILPENGWLE